MSGSSIWYSHLECPGIPFRYPDSASLCTFLVPFVLISGLVSGSGSRFHRRSDSVSGVLFSTVCSGSCFYRDSILAPSWLRQCPWGACPPRAVVQRALPPLSPLLLRTGVFFFIATVPHLAGRHMPHTAAADAAATSRHLTPLPFHPLSPTRVGIGVCHTV